MRRRPQALAGYPGGLDARSSPCERVGCTHPCDRPFRGDGQWGRNGIAARMEQPSEDQCRTNTDEHVDETPTREGRESVKPVAMEDVHDGKVVHEPEKPNENPARSSPKRLRPWSQSQAAPPSIRPCQLARALFRSRRERPDRGVPARFESGHCAQSPPSQPPGETKTPLERTALDEEPLE
jgi:hypothetical protein